MPNYGSGAITYSEYQSKDVPNFVQKQKVTRIVVVCEPSTRSTPIASQVGSDHMKSR